MHKFYLSLIVLGLLFTTPTKAEDVKKVFACEPEWASLAKEIGGDKLEVSAATTAMEDPHHVRAKPSLIAAMRKADFVICSGAGLEIGWLPILLETSGNAKVQMGKIANLQASDVVEVLDKQTSVDRSQGDIHPEGNPHIQLNPHNIALVAKELANRLAQIDAENSAYYQSQYEVFNGKWQQSIKKWESEAVSLKGIPVVVHHTSFAYLNNWLGLNQVATLEPKPGIPPTTGHLEELLQTMKASPAKVILRSPYDAEDASLWLSEKTGIPAVKMPYTVGGSEAASDLFGLFDSTIMSLKGAVSAK